MLDAITQLLSVFNPLSKRVTHFDEHHTRSGTIIPCGGTLEAGDEGLEFNTSNVHGQYIIEVLFFVAWQADIHMFARARPLASAASALR